MKTKRIVPTVLLLLTLITSSAQNIKGTFAIKNVETGKLLRIKDANNSDLTPLVSYSPVNRKCMTWDFKPVSGEIYQLRNLFTNRTFTTESETPDVKVLNTHFRPSEYHLLILIKNNEG